MTHAIHAQRHGALALALSLSLLVTLLGCSDDIRPGDPTLHVPSGSGDGTGGTDGRRVVIEPLNTPRITYDTGTGKTTVVVQFIARDDTGAPLGTDDIRAELLVDGAALDNESVLEADAEELSSSVHLGLVLDTSYSMLQHTPPAFHPMLEAARDALVAGAALYANRPGTFTWSLAWFDELIHVPADPWVPSDILSIPEPGQGTATKLFGAVEFEAEAMLDAYGTVANGPNDHHVLVVFSDGADNYSWFDNSSTVSEGQTANGSPYASAGYAAATLASAEAAIAAHPALTAHVIGLGSAVNDDDLSALAAAGDGRYFKNLASSEIGTLFDQVVQEFATIQDRGATIPLPPGDYAFMLRVMKTDGTGVDTFSFDFHAGDEDAGIIETP